MNFKSKSDSPLDWKKILVVIVVVGLAGYTWYTEGKSENGNEVAVFNDDSRSEEPGDAQRPSDRDADFGRTNTDSRDANLDSASNDSASTDSEFLVSIGGDRFQSPAGLIYGMGGGGEHRIDHVMRHARDDPGRPAHGVFHGDRNEILQLLDEVYELIKSDSPAVDSESSRGNMAYTVKLDRKVGYEGGQKGRRNGNRDLESVRLILDGNKVITAYPYR